MPLICIPIKTHTQKQAFTAIKEIFKKADLAELWLDEIKGLDLPALLRSSPLPVICKGKAELLAQAARAGADYIDIPFAPHIATYSRSNKKFVQLKSSLCRLIISHHDFKKTPSSSALLALALRMAKSGADIVKIATRANSFSDTFRIILLAQELKARGIPHILIAMGSKGRLSRIITPHLGGTIMYAPIKKAEATALGKLTTRELRKAWSLIKSPV